MGGVGVDFFLFLSGLGMYYSLRKKKSVLEWYKRRYLRILIPYFVFAVPYYIFRLVVDGDGIILFLSNISTISFWTRHEGAWFVAMLIPLYMLTPLFASIIDGAKYRWISTIILCGLAIVGASVTNSDEIRMCLAHLPSFFVGYYIAFYVSNDIEVRCSWILLCFIAYFVVLFFSVKLVFGFSRNWMLVLPASVILAEGLNSKKMKSINKIFSFLGTISLESYLANIFLPVVLRKVGLVSFMQTFDAGNYVFYLIVVFAGVGLAYVGHIISERVLVVIQNGNRK